jgi:hypothetical protein
MAFFILSTCNIENLFVLPIDELVLLILEDLPPVGISAPDLEVG